MGKRRFEMHEYRQIIVRLRLGETIRGLAQSKLASRKKIRVVRKIAIQQKWLDTQRGTVAKKYFYSRNSKNAFTNKLSYQSK
jgi:hypothetical protein